jgi:PKHD-type hydroxylase
MNFQIFRILEREEVDRMLSTLVRQTFVDGKVTAQGPARDAKNNLQVERRGPDLTDLDHIVLSGLRRNEDFQAFAFPQRLLLPIFSRYEPGMEYGSHVDNAVMGTGNEALRSDFAVTLFLSEPDSYDGGELVLEMAVGEQEIKLDAGEAIVYAATTVHRVAPITRGARLAAVTWVQSAVKDERLRAILFDLGTVSKQVEGKVDSGTVTLLHKSYHNLLRHSIDL